MDLNHRILFSVTICLALAFGFLPLFLPDFPYDFDRLHIFLFNLCAGGALLLTHGTAARKPTPRIWTYFGLSLAYALTAFFNIFGATLAISLPLWLIVESVRVRRFGFIPWDFFRRGATQDKFLHAALLCLSLGIPIASLVIINNEYLHLIHLEKLTIDVFFLGYSFPLSLLTFSVMFNFTRPAEGGLYAWLNEVSFWSITTGVVGFFVFIIFELTVPEIIISNTLFAAVILTHFIFIKTSKESQQRSFLSSGMFFLFITAITGILYLFEYIYPDLKNYHEQFLVLHATVALYGWNLSGLFIVVRWNDFPISSRPGTIIAIHWVTVFLLVPLGKYFTTFALMGLPVYVTLIYLTFIAQPQHRTTA
jgi:hypothetical protein